MSAATDLPPRLPTGMTVESFIAWAMRQPDGRYELISGEVVAMAPERVIHTDAKLAVVVALRDAIAAAGLPCRAYVDGLTVRIDARTAYVPDALVRCGERPDPNTIDIDDPLIVVEIVSPSSARADRGAKLEGYFRLPTVSHYLILKTEARAVIHHARAADGTITTRILREGLVTLEPPGIAIAVAAMFE